MGEGAATCFSARFLGHSSVWSTASRMAHVAGPNDDDEGRTARSSGGRSTMPRRTELRRAGELAEQRGGRSSSPVGVAVYACSGEGRCSCWRRRTPAGIREGGAEQLQRRRASGRRMVVRGDVADDEERGGHGAETRRRRWPRVLRRRSHGCVGLRWGATRREREVARVRPRGRGVG